MLLAAGLLESRQDVGPPPASIRVRRQFTAALAQRGLALTHFRPLVG
jgi:hypothetical protein